MRISVKEVKVIRTETTEGTGTKEDPVRTMVRYWGKDGTLISEKEKTLFSD